jgi:hypothetical protein
MTENLENFTGEDMKTTYRCDCAICKSTSYGVAAVVFLLAAVFMTVFLVSQSHAEVIIDSELVDHPQIKIRR